jgi:hypothetical protein
VYEHKVKLRLITPGKPMENGCDVESKTLPTSAQPDSTYELG